MTLGFQDSPLGRLLLQYHIVCTFLYTVLKVASRRGYPSIHCVPLSYIVAPQVCTVGIRVLAPQYIATLCATKLWPVSQV